MSWRKRATLAQTCEGGLLAIADLGDEDWEEGEGEGKRKRKRKRKRREGMAT
jgi:hypothetical protein